VRILYPENPRFPPEGSSAEGKSGPKARLKSVVDGQRVNIPVPLFVDIEGRRRLSWPDIGFTGLNVRDDEKRRKRFELRREYEMLRRRSSLCHTSKKSLHCHKQIMPVP
jgi:hypothetical protein